MKSLLLIYPPLAKNCEPPAGIARLAGTLRASNVNCTTIDLNWQGLQYLLGLDCLPADTWSSRAKKQRSANIAALQNQNLYTNFDRYKRAVADINRVLAGVGKADNIELSLANYQDQTSPVQSIDLIETAEEYAENIFFPLFSNFLADTIDSSSPDIIGISITYLSQAVSSFALIGFLRARFPGVKIVIGGGLVTSWMRGPFWSDPFHGLVDECIAGPGETPLLALLSEESCQLVHAAPEYDRQDYLSPVPVLPYAASTGCYWNKCLFCPETAEDNPYTAFSTKQVLADLDILLKRYQYGLLHFLDNALSPALMQALVKNPPGIPWYSFARASSLLAAEDFCRELRNSGCVMLKLGLESGDQQVLDNMEKGIELPMVSQVLRSLRAAGIMTYVYLLFGTPSEDEASATKTMEFTARHHKEISFLNLAVFNLPHSGPEAGSLSLKEFYDGDLSLYSDFIHPKGWNRQKIRAFLSRRFKRHPLITPIIQRDPPVFTSNHAPFFYSSFFANSLPLEW